MCPRLSERVLQRRVEEVAVLVPPGLVDEFSRIEVAIAGVALQVTREVVGAKQVRLCPDVAGSGSGSRPEHPSGLVVERITIGRSPEEILLKRERKIAHRGYRDSGIGTDDILPPDVIHVTKERVGVRVELIEGADASAGLLIAAGIVELEIDAR